MAPGTPMEFQRTARTSISLRPGELEDVRRVAREWQVPVGVVLWVLVHDGIMRWRGRECTPEGRALAAAIELVHRCGMRVVGAGRGAADEDAGSGEG